MENLSDWRERWERVAAYERKLKRPMTVQQRVLRYLELRETFAARLQETSRNHREERMNYLADLQARLRRLAEFQHGLRLGPNLS